MNALQENKLNMFLLVNDNLETEPVALLQTMPGFLTLLTDFTATVDQIRDKNEFQTANRKGYKIVKTNKKNLMIKHATNLAACVKAYADSVHNEVLSQEMKQSRSELSRKRDSTAADVSKFITIKATENLTDAAPFGVSQVIIEEIDVMIANFNTNIPLPRMSILNKKILTYEIKKLFTIANDYIKSMDTLVNILELTNPEFYQKYYFSRKTVNNHGKKLSMRGTVINEQEVEIAAVNVSIPSISRTTKTTAKGYFEFKNLPAGVHNVIFERPGYETTNRQIGTVTSVRQQLEVTMVAIENSQKVA